MIAKTKFFYCRMGVAMLVLMLSSQAAYPEYFRDTNCSGAPITIGTFAAHWATDDQIAYCIGCRSSRSRLVIPHMQFGGVPMVIDICYPLQYVSWSECYDILGGLVVPLDAETGEYRVGSFMEDLRPQLHKAGPPMTPTQRN